MSYASRFGAGTSDVLHEKTNLLGGTLVLSKEGKVVHEFRETSSFYQGEAADNPHPHPHPHPHPYPLPHPHPNPNPTKARPRTCSLRSIASTRRWRRPGQTHLRATKVPRAARRALAYTRLSPSSNSAGRGAPSAAASMTAPHAKLRREAVGRSKPSRSGGG